MYEMYLKTTMKSETLRDKNRQIVAINRANSRSKMFHQNRSIGEELPDLKMEKGAHQKHRDQRLVHLREQRAKVKLRARLIQGMSVGEQAVAFAFRSETFKPPSNLDMNVPLEKYFLDLRI
ncbi:uncharacterized protein [Drosophila bipectinata]|uniref:uncharacterized protein n=1 Tax=Drosophila bipectinata TaxID=42026 RepID=UPI001C8A575C|nr:uncharacterized protein LOC122321916 [Drosophila bipectinata]